MTPARRTSASNPVRDAHGSGGPLDAVDTVLVRELRRDGRQTNQALADAAGIAPSTCLLRVRELQRRGVLRGVHADVDLARVGRPLQAIIAVRMRAHVKEQVQAFRAEVPRLAGVLSLFHVSGKDDYLLHVAVADADDLRRFVVDHLTGHPAVGHTETNLVFEHLPGRADPLEVAQPSSATASTPPPSSGSRSTSSGPSTSSTSSGAGRSRPAARPSR
jgi:DNA-binding Lrp family transcriptional regulator